tara:strand:- start:422 stop:1630 length:1209 start_codon:yes stop_codon:yes gene_type:complete
MSEIVRSVNRVYAKENPSTYARNIKDLKKLISDRKSFLLKLKLPPQIFKNTELIDFGCGTGQNTILYDNLGSNCTLLEYDRASYQSCLRLFKKYAINKFKVHNVDIFKYKIKSSKFDFVVSNGVAHHTENPRKNIEICCKATKKGGFFILGIGNKAGFFQRNLQRLILYNICKDESEIIKYSKILFKENLSRAVKYSGRSINEIIYDTYLNPKIESFSTKDIVNIFNRNGLSLYSSYQDVKSVTNFFEPNSEQFKIKKKINQNYDILKKDTYLSDIQDLTISNNKAFNSKTYSELNKVSKRLNELADRVNDINFEKNINLNKLLEGIKTYKKELSSVNKVEIIDKDHNNKFLNELIILIKYLKSNKKVSDKIENISYLILNSDRLFRKYNGVGMNFYCGYKN